MARPEPYGGLTEEQHSQLTDAWFALHPEACLNPSVDEMVRDLERARAESELEA